MDFSIQPEKIYELINKNICFIDIREKEQFDNLHIRNFMNMPASQFDYSKLPHNQPICMICYSGGQTKKLVEQLRSKGYQAYYIQGGFQAFLNLQNNQYY